MKDIFIKKVNKFLRAARPCLPEDKICNVFQSGDLLEIGFMSGHCKRDYTGSCIMCDYGRTDRTFTITEYIDKMQTILSHYQEGINFLLICCNGSFFDESQISTELFKAILSQAQSCKIPNIIIETHYNDVTPEKLEIIKNTITKPLIIEMGLETANQEYQNKIIMKGIDLKKYENTINLIKKCGYKIELNIMLGLPFLSIQEQLADVKNTIQWAIEHGCEPVVFPINIKPYTLLNYAYEKNFYKPVSAWLIIKLLDDLDNNALKKIIIAWYGNRDEPYPNGNQTVLPVACEHCRQKLLNFGIEFLAQPSAFERRKLITKLKNSAVCNCYNNLEKDINNQPQTSFNNIYNKFYERLKIDFKDLYNGVTNE